MNAVVVMFSSRGARYEYSIVELILAGVMGSRVRSVSRGPRNQSGFLLSKMTTLGVVVVGEGWMDTRYASRSDIKFGLMMFMGPLLMVTRVTFPVVWNSSVPNLAGAGGVTFACVGAAISRALREVRRCFVENRMVLLSECADVGLESGKMTSKETTVRVSGERLDRNRRGRTLYLLFQPGP